MTFNYKPKNKLEKFGQKVYSALVENFPQTFFVGGMVRDLLLNRDITDIDIATNAKPENIVSILKQHGIAYDDRYKNFGNIIAKENGEEIEVTTFRKDLKATSRYPKVSFVKGAKTDSARRDFTVNALYLNAKNGQFMDYHKGLADIVNKRIRFIGNPKKRIQEDPLRVIRALRFALVLNFSLEKLTGLAIKNNFSAIKKLTRAKINKEIEKIKSPKDKKILSEVINSPKILDKYFK